MMDDLEFTRACEEFVPPGNEFTPIAPEKFNGTTTQEKQTLTNRLKKAMMLVAGAIAAGVVTVSTAGATLTPTQTEPPNMEELGEFFGEVYDILLNEEDYESFADYEKIYRMIKDNQKNLWLQYQNYYDENIGFNYMFNPDTDTLISLDGELHPDETGMIIHGSFIDSYLLIEIAWCHFYNYIFEKPDVFFKYCSEEQNDKRASWSYVSTAFYDEDFSTSKNTDILIDSGNILINKGMLVGGRYRENIQGYCINDDEEYYYKIIIDDSGRYVIYDLGNDYNKNIDMYGNKAGSLLIKDNIFDMYPIGVGMTFSQIDLSSYSNIDIDYMVMPQGLQGFLKVKWDNYRMSWQPATEDDYVIVPYPEQNLIDYEYTTNEYE
jgi:hypothetical protein